MLTTLADNSILPELGVGGGLAVLMVGLVFNFLRTYKGPGGGSSGRVLHELEELRVEVRLLREDFSRAHLLPRKHSKGDHDETHVT